MLTRRDATHGLIDALEARVAEAKREEVEVRRERGYEVLAVMEGHLTRHDFFVGGRYSIADIALYAYTHVAHEGGFDLAPYVAIRAWLDRVRAQPRHIPITQG
jgi:glutathione S-transferase